ncbi:MAG: RNA polymerase sigma factor [Ornithinimicrobium sp.]
MTARREPPSADTGPGPDGLTVSEGSGLADSVGRPTVPPPEAPPLPRTADSQPDDPASVTPGSLSEATWVARARDGDPASYEHLIRAYEGELFRLAYRLMSDRGEAQDVVQDVLVLVWRQLPSLSDPRAFRSWVYQITTRRCLNLLRNRTRQRTELARSEPGAAHAELDGRAAPQAHDPAGVTQARALHEALDDALATLPPEQRACWVLHHLHDLTYPEISYAIGAPISTIRGRIARARQNLARGLTAWQ